MKQLLTSLSIVLALATPAFAQLGAVPTTFSAGATIRSADFNTMFSQIYANALNRTGGTMTGSLTTLGLLPTADNTSDIGSLALSYKDAWIQGTLTVGTVSATTISGGLGALTTIIQTTLTTQQLSLRYDASNHLAVTVASNGATTFDATGAGQAFVFSDAATFSSTLAAGAITSTGLFTNTLTTQQALFRYDASNHLGITVASNGATTLNATGAGQAFAFSDAVSVTGTVSASGVFISNSISGLNRTCDMTAGDATITGGLTTDCVAADPSVPSLREEVAYLKSQVAELRALLAGPR